MLVRGCAVAVLVCLGLAVSAAPAELTGFIGSARDADIVILGEIHDNPAHHANQRDIVAALSPSALVFEMIPQSEEAGVNDLRAHGAPDAEIARALDWDESGWPEFSYYAEILAAAPRAQVFGAEQPRADVRRAMVEGAAGPFGPDAAIYGLDLPLPAEEKMAREALLAEAHCGQLPPEILPGMVEAQRFRDASLADAALWARTMTGGGQVVVITGSGHADKARGMPALVAIADPEVRVLSLGQFEAEPANRDDFDAVILSDAPERDDPCASIN